MNRQIITKELFLDMDEILLMEIEPFTFLENNTGKTGYKVMATTKNNLRIPLYEERQSGEQTKCYQWVMENWIKKQK